MSFDRIRVAAALFLFLLVVADLSCAGICDQDLPDMQSHNGVLIGPDSNQADNLHHSHLADQCLCCSTTLLIPTVPVPDLLLVERSLQAAVSSFAFKTEYSAIYHPPRV